jgi:phosphoglycolate phosphatase
MNIKIKYIVFDLNGTLIDAMSIYTRVFCDVLKRRTEIEDPDIPNIVKYSVAATGTPWDEQFAYVLDLHKYPTDEVPKLMDEFCDIVNEEKYLLYPKVKELLQAFKEKGYRILITSGSSTGAMIKRIYDLGILNNIDFLLGFDTYKKSLKHMEMLAESENMSLKEFAKQSIYFGDGPGDMRIAKSSGLYAIGIAQTVSSEILKDAGADLVLDKIGDVLKMDWEKVEMDSGPKSSDF